MESNNAHPAVAVQHLTFTYPEAQTPALSDVCLTAAPGEFIVLCGSSGCGKTTLLRQLKPALAPHGVLSGEIFFEGTPLRELPDRDAAAKIGFVLQSPENQLVTDKVWHELAFGLESLGYKTPEIRLRTAEMASYFGIQTWFYKNVAELSGGQKQLLALASVMALSPSLLILDEPTAQLDPIAASDFLSTVGKINRELGVTVILTEHRLEEALPLASRAVVMDGGRVICDGSPEHAGQMLRKTGHGMFSAMPVPMRVWAAVDNALACPVTVRDGREWLTRLGAENMTLAAEQTRVKKPREAPAVELDEVWFRYGKDLPDVVRGLSFRAYPGEVTAILGGNGAGKTTALSLIAGLNKAYRGSVKIEGEALEKIPHDRLFDRLLGVLPQNPQTVFAAKTVREDLLEMLSGRRLARAEKSEKLENIAQLCRLEGLLDRHPYDLSGGEQQRAAAAKVLLLEPKILLLDEPTKGLDAQFKAVFAGILRRLTDAGAAVIMVSHDLEFCAEYADRCALFFDGQIVTENAPREFFSGNSFYTTAANRMARHLLPSAVTAGDVIAALGGTVPPAPEEELPGSGGTYTPGGAPDVPRPKPAAKRLTRPRLAALCLSAALFVLTAAFAIVHREGFLSFLSGGEEAIRAAGCPAQAWLYAGLMLALAAELIGAILAVSWRRGGRERAARPAPVSQRLGKRTAAAAAMILLAIPLTIFAGIYFFGDRKFYFVSLLVIFESMLPFALIFESRKPQARELTVIAVLCAIAVAGRAAFFMLPQFKPVLALVIISGVAFGGEAGFLVGSVTAFVSNMFFGQGPWTPWQMFAFGITGFLAGVLFKKGLLTRGRAALCAFGALCAVCIYGGLMNPCMVITYNARPTLQLLLAAYLQGLPFDLVHALATAVFLAVGARAMLEKLDRIKVKYGLTE